MLVDSVIVVGCEYLPEAGEGAKTPFDTVVKTQNCLLVIIIPVPAVAVMSG